MYTSKWPTDSTVGVLADLMTSVPRNEWFLQAMN